MNYKTREWLGLGNKERDLMKKIMITAILATNCLLSLGSLHAAYKFMTPNKMYEAAKRGQWEAVKEFIEKDKADVNYQGFYDFTALIWTVLKNNLEMVKYLVEKGAKLDLEDLHGYTALYHAQYSKFQDIVDYLTMVTDYYAARTNKTVSDFLGTLTKEQLQDIYNIAYNQKHYDVLKEEQFNRRLKNINKKNEFNTNNMNFKFE